MINARQCQIERRVDLRKISVARDHILYYFLLCSNYLCTYISRHIQFIPAHIFFNIWSYKKLGWRAINQRPNRIWSHYTNKLHQKKYAYAWLQYQHGRKILYGKKAHLFIAGCVRTKSISSSKYHSTYI